VSQFAWNIWKNPDVDTTACRISAQGASFFFARSIPSFLSWLFGDKKISRQYALMSN
jgi:hypothetical protein